MKYKRRMGSRKFSIYNEFNILLDIECEWVAIEAERNDCKRRLHQ